MCSVIVLMSSLLFYNVENRKNKENPLNEEVCPNFGLVLYQTNQSWPLVTIVTMPPRKLDGTEEGEKVKGQTEIQSCV